MTSIIKVNNLQNQCGANIISESANVITIGASGDTVTLAAGASQSGFGRSGSVNWDTTAKTTTVTAVNGVGYFINTTSAGVTVNLPAGTAGSIVALADYAATWNTNAVTVNANGTDKIGGVASAPATLNTQGQSVTFIYVDSTEGWINVGDATAVAGNPFVTATGGTITTCGDYKIHTFTGPGTFTVTNAGTPAGSTTVDYLVVAGGGGGGATAQCSSIPGAGGGAGGFRMSNSTSMPAPTTSPLANPAGLPVSLTAYPITVGGGGSGKTVSPCGAIPGNSGTPSIFSTITSTGGGGGGGRGNDVNESGLTGGSGGGSSGVTNVPGAAGNTPPTSPPQGSSGGRGATSGGAGKQAGGGGGAGGAGGDGNPGPSIGGIGSFVSPSFAGSNGTPGPVGSTRYFAGGGGVGSSPLPAAATAGGAGGGATGGNNAGTTNTGGGGGGGSAINGTSGSGGSGIVIIRYKFQ